MGQYPWASNPWASNPESRFIANSRLYMGRMYSPICGLWLTSVDVASLIWSEYRCPLALLFKGEILRKDAAIREA